MYDDIEDIEDIDQPNGHDHDMQSLEEEASYVCDSCGEEIVVPLDNTAGRSQQYVEDCPVCCCPNVIYVEIDEDGHAAIHSHGE